MKSISIKGKILILLTAVLILLLIVGYLNTPELMASSIEKQEQAGKQSAALVLKQRLIKFFPGSAEARSQVYSLADRLLQSEDRIMIGPGFTGGGGSKDILLTAEEVIPLIRRVAESQNEVMWQYNTYQKLAELYRFQGNYEKAEETFLSAVRGFAQEKKDFRVAEVNVLLAKLYLEIGEIDKALKLMELSIENYPEQQRGEILSLQGDAYFQLGDYLLAERHYLKAMEQVEQDWAKVQEHLSAKVQNINAELENQPIYRHCRSRLGQLTALGTEGEAGKGKVQGGIFAGTKPMPNILVYLIKEQDHDGRMNNFEGIAAALPAHTDSNGRFEFNSVVPGRYFIVLGVSPQDLEGLGRLKSLDSFQVEKDKISKQEYVFQPKVEISEPVGRQDYSPGEELKINWKEVSEASFYNIHIALKLDNGYVSRVYRQNLKDNSYVLAPQGLALREMPFVAWGDGELAPSAVLGSFYPGAEIFFIIEAMDEQGRPISDSEGYVLQFNGNYPSIFIAESDEAISEGDKLVLQGQYKEAIEAYKDELQEKPADSAVLLSLARIYNSYGLAEQSEPGQPFRDLSDPRKALEYYRALLEITREKFIVEEAASTAVRSGDENLALELFEEIEEEFEENSFWYHLMGELYFKTGQLDKALSSYLKYLDGQEEFRDLGPVAAMLFQGNTADAIKLLQTKSYSEKVRYNGDGETEKPADIKNLLRCLEKYQKGTPGILSTEDFRKYLLEIVRIDGDNRFAKVKKFQQKVNSIAENDVLVQVLVELAKDRR